MKTFTLIIVAAIATATVVQSRAQETEVIIVNGKPHIVTTTDTPVTIIDGTPYIIQRP